MSGSWRSRLGLGWVRDLWRHLRTEHTTSGRLVAAVAVGLFVGTLPLYGLHLPICVGLSVLLPVLMFSLMASAATATVLFAAVTMALIAGAVSAVGAVATAEQFRGEARITGLALGATTATAIFGGLTPYLAQLLIDGTGRPEIPGVMIALVALCVSPVFLLMRETRPTPAQRS